MEKINKRIEFWVTEYGYDAPMYKPPKKLEDYVKSRIKQNKRFKGKKK